MVISIETDVSVRKDASGALKRAQRERLKDSGQYGLNHAVEMAPEDRGTLTDDLIDAEWQDGKLIWGFNAHYAKAQEFGTDPYLAPFGPLVEWADRVGGGYGLAIYVWRKIAREGIEEKGFARHGRDKQKQWLKSNSLGEYLEREL